MAYASNYYKSKSRRYSAVKKAKYRKYHGSTATQAASAVIVRAAKALLRRRQFPYISSKNLKYKKYMPKRINPNTVKFGLGYGRKI